MSTNRLIARTFLTATTIVGAALVPATVSAEPTPEAASLLTLAVHEGDQKVPARTATLACEPTGGTHPYADESCNSLKAAHGDFNGLRRESTMCTMELAPVTVTAEGTWQRRPVRFEKSFSNSCVAKAETEKLFAF